MVGSRGTCLYKEARLNIEPAFPGSTISVTLPAQDTSTFGARVHPKRTVVTEQNDDRSEDGFAKRHLASDGAMYFRKHHGYPRAFLWRLLDNRRVMEIQSADLDHDDRNLCEANVTFLLHFSAPIRPFCIAFAEPEDRDSLTVFAITTANELYTINIHRDFFMRPAASEQEISEWCRFTSPAQFTLRVPYRLVAVSNKELLVTLDNGGILYLTRNSRDDIFWNESVYQETSWSMRGLLPWKGEQKVRFGNGDLSISAAAAVAISPDREHILSVCLNHKLRAWNLASGRPGIQMDLLGEPDVPNDKAPFLIGPSQPNLMTVVEISGGVEGGAYHVVTYSPKQHQFKFWGIRDADEAEHGVFDVRSDFDFVPPIDELMDTTAWTVEEFFINPGPTGWKGAEIWIRARSGPSSKVYSLKFDLHADLEKLTSTWKTGWASVDSGPLSVEQLKQNPANPAEQQLEASELFEMDVTERWLEFLFYPGRFTTATLEAALLVFRRGLERAKTPQSKGSLKERICAIVGAFAALGQEGVVGQEVYQETLAAQWQAFYSLIKDLHKRRGECLSLSFDYAEGMPWLVLSDYLSAIRACSHIELIPSNSTALTGSNALTGPLSRMYFKRSEGRHVARLLNAAASFRKTLPRSVHSRLQQEVEGELLQSRAISVVDRMELMEVNCNLSQQVSDDDLAALVEELGMDVKELTTEIFFAATELLGQQEEGRKLDNRQIARFGLSALVRVSQEKLELAHGVLLDLLVLVLFMQFEEDLSEDFDAVEIFVEIINQLKDITNWKWMAGNVWAHPAPTGTSSETLMANMAKTYKGGKFPITQTVLEGILGRRAFDVKIPKGLHTQLLTYWSSVWLGQEYNDRTFDAYLEDVMAMLLERKEYALALEYSKYLPESNWATYLKGRMHLYFNENDLASICFKKAAYNLALGEFNIADADDTDMIKADQRDSFSNGLPKYYLHVLALFEHVKAYPFVADFARLGLKCLRGRENEELRTDLLSRLFNASIQTAQFDDAYSAMIRHTNTALRSAALSTLITTMISQSLTTHLLAYPFVGLVSEVDSLLLSHALKSLSLSPKGPQYHLILHSFRIARNNFRGAASILYDRLQRLKSSSEKTHDPADQSLIQCYLMIINTLSCVGKDDAYILAEARIDTALHSGVGMGKNSGVPGRLDFGIGKAKKLLKRQIVTLESLRKEYQAELDRVEAIESGKYPFVEAGDEMDIL